NTMAWFYAAEWPTFAPPLTGGVVLCEACEVHTVAGFDFAGIGVCRADFAIGRFLRSFCSRGEYVQREERRRNSRS
ncbi:hypothetical protein, partial [Sphingobium sp. ba1]|uniref:hypothetical protein n=1 Tax=Sphingobium sp. ba1 TaxID=1522072 RepID=UPI001ED9C251